MLYYLKDFTYKGKKYKFKTQLKVIISNFLASDGKTMCSELSIQSVADGYTKIGIINDPDKEIKEYIKSVFDNFLTKEDSTLNEYDLKYKKDWINLFLKPGEKVERKKVIKIPTKKEIKLEVKKKLKNSEK